MTGAAGTIGRALLRRLWAEPAWAGVRFVVSGREAGALEALARERPAGQAGVDCVVADLDSSADVQALGRRLADLGALQGMALVAGINHDDPLPRLAEEAWDRVWAVNVGAHARLLAGLSRPGALAPGACGILVGSIVGLRGNAGQAAYAAAKGALLDLLPRAPAGLRLNLLLPPLVESPLLAGLSAQARERLFQSRLLQDPDPADSCARAGAFLLSDASAYVHRQVLHADSRVTALGWD